MAGPAPKTSKRRRTRAKSPATKTPSAQVLRRQIARLTAAWEAERSRNVRALAAVRRGADRRLAAMVAEIASLRHHEARAAALSRLLEERDARIAELETLLRSPTQLG